MPVIEVSALPQKPGVEPAKVLGRLCSEVSRIIGLKPSQVWATWRTLEPGHFVEGPNAAAAQPGATHPPIVRLSAFEGRAPERIEAALDAIAEILCEELGMTPGNAFIVYDELLSGRVYTGGRVKKKG